MTDEEMLERLGSTHKTTSFGEWTRPPETWQSRRVDAICNVYGPTASVGRREFTVRGFSTPTNWEAADVAMPKI